MKAVVVLCLALFSFPFFSHAEELNIGFVEGIWYSSEPVFVGVPTRVYVAFRNNTPHDITGTVRFTDNGKRIGSSEVSVLSGRIAEAWIDWIPTEGEHSVSATLSDAKLHKIGEPSSPISVTNVIAEDKLAIDYDTDRDGVGNTIDTDDDSDGVSDTDELARGTDPLRANPKPTEVKENLGEEKTETVAEPVTERVQMIRPGLEQYLPNGTIASVVQGVTEEIHETQRTLDSYRKERNDSLNTPKETPSLAPTGTSTDNATITRSKIETDTSLLEALIGGIGSILRNVHTFFLFLLSGLLGRPAFVELVLLLLILYFFYRTARYFGRRPNW